MNKSKKPHAAVAFVQSILSPSPSEVDLTTAKGFVQDMLQRIKNTELTALGAQLAYFFLLSFFPLLIFMVSLLPYLNLEQGAVFDFMDDIMPAEIFSLIEGILSEVLTNQSGGLLSIGILGTIWSASRGIDALTRALNKAYDTEARPGWKNKAWSILFTISFVIVILLSLVLPVFGQQITNLILGYLSIDFQIPGIWNFIRFATPPTLVFLVICVMYWIVPNTDPRIKLISVLPGALIAATGFFALTFGFSFYINNFGNYSATYGSIGGVIVLMLWLYFIGMILIFGGIINAVFAQRKLAKVCKKTRKTPTF
ncbi:MAG: YihY/virulence factor BrkB family protein [Solibacillus sp.]